MSSIQCPPLPLDTARAAESIFGKEHPYLKIGGSLETVWEKLDLSALRLRDVFLLDSFYPCALVTILQYWEYLTDRQMSQATRTRLDMKYALHLPLNFPGVEPSTLCEFRQRILGDPLAYEALEAVVGSLSCVADRGNSLSSVDRMIRVICLPSRAETILGCMGLALEAVASRQPEWLKMYALPHWYRRYYQKFDHEKIPPTPLEIELLIQSVGNDGRHLLAMIEKSNTVSLRKLPEIRALQSEWHRQFVMDEDMLKFRKTNCLTCSREPKFIKTGNEKGGQTCS